jgi:hypothetical protein
MSKVQVTISGDRAALIGYLKSLRSGHTGAAKSLADSHPAKATEEKAKAAGLGEAITALEQWTDTGNGAAKAPAFGGYQPGPTGGGAGG